jgi:O-antigen/teichoic acid export membrane protein
VIAKMLAVSAVTFFSIGDRLVDYTGEVVSSLAQVFVPMSGRSDANGDTEQLRKILIAGNRACALIVFPITATLIVLGKSVITAWMGAGYVQRCYPVMVTVLIPSTFALAQAASPRILYGMAKHRSLAWVTGMEAIANLILSVVLIRPLGLVGDALGTAIPLTCTALFFMPRHLCRVLSVRVWFFLRQAYTLPILLCTPTVAALLLVRHWFFARSYMQVGFQILIGLTPYGIGLAWAISKARIWEVDGMNARKSLERIETTFFEAPLERP